MIEQLLINVGSCFSTIRLAIRIHQVALIKRHIHSSITFASIIHAKLLHNHDIVSIQFNHFPRMNICDTLRRHLCMLTYIYCNVNEHWLTSPKETLNLQILHYTVILENVVSKRLVLTLQAVEVTWSHVANVLDNLMINTIHAWLAKDDRSPSVFHGGGEGEEGEGKGGEVHGHGQR